MANNENVKTVNCTPEISKKCAYGGKVGAYTCCQFILVEGKRRGCSARKCIYFTSGPKKKIKEDY